jgi:ferredoxin
LVPAGQLNLWLHDQRIGVGPRFVIPIAIRLRGRLDTDALNQALGDVMERHEIPRTIYTCRSNGRCSRCWTGPADAGR